MERGMAYALESLFPFGSVSEEVSDFWWRWETESTSELSWEVGGGGLLSDVEDDVWIGSLFDLEWSEREGGRVVVGM